MKKEDLESVRNLKGFNTVFSDSAFNFGARIISNIFYFLFITFIVKVLGEDRYGQYSVFLMVAQFIYIGFLVWLQSGLLRYGREEFTETNKINKIFTAHLSILIPLIIILISLVFIFRNYILSYLKFDRIFLYIIIIYFIMNYITEMLYYSLQALGEIKTMSIAQSIEKVIPIFIMIAGYYIFGITKLSFVVAVVLCGHLFSQIFILLKINFRNFFPLNFDRNIFNRYIKYSIPIFFGSLSAYFMSWIDVGIIKNNLSMEKVGHFFYCQQISNGLSQINIVLFTILSPLVITLIVKKRTDLSKVVLENFSLLLTVFMALIINILWVILYFVLSTIFETDIFEISLTLKLLLFSYLIGINYKILSSYMIGYELTILYSFNNIILVTLKIILSLILIMKIGIVGAAIATFLSKIFSLYFAEYFIKKKVQFNFKLNNFFIFIMLGQIIIYYYFQNIIINFIINFLLIITFVKVFKVFSKEKIKIINEIEDIPIILKKTLLKISNIIG